VWAALLACLALQLALRASEPAAPPSAEDLPPPPRAATLRLAGLGESAAAARLAMLYLQAFDLHAGNELAYRRLDYARLVAWLRAILDTDPRSDYPLFAAARVYAEVPDERRARMMLEFVYEEFAKDPDRRWPWLAHAALLAKHRLRDLPLALRYATALERQTTGTDVPLWAKQMEIFILEDMNELDAARIMLGGLLETGRIADPAERRFLQWRLEQLGAPAARQH
jgi:hypothetical protein